MTYKDHIANVVRDASKRRIHAQPDIERAVAMILDYVPQGKKAEVAAMEMREEVPNVFHRRARK